MTALLRIVDRLSQDGEIKLDDGAIKLHVRMRPVAGSKLNTPIPEANSAEIDSVAATAQAGPVAKKEITPPSITKEPIPEKPRNIEEPAGLKAVTALIAGVFYTSPAPGEPPFVTTGQRVNAGEPIGIIEVMKLMNCISAPCAGVIKEICVSNEQLVEYGQELMWIKED